jgi:molybdate transport system substrate-binding protein
MKNICKQLTAVIILAITLILSINCSTPTPGLITPSSINSTATINNVDSVVTGKTITVFAGSASKPALDDAAAAFKKETGITVYCTYGGSGTVLSQMKISKSGDIYIPGSPDYIIIADREGVIDPASIKIISYLVPVIAVQQTNPKNIKSLEDLTKPGIKMGMGNPESVCLGLYSIELFEYNHLLSEIGKNIVTYAESCDKTASIIALKAVDAVIGWDVFHDWNPAIDVIYLKPNQIPRIAYIPSAISTYTKDKLLAKKFTDFLISQQGQEIFKKWGYISSESEAKKFAPGASVGGEYKLPYSYQKLMVK